MSAAEQAWKLLEEAVVRFEGRAVGAMAANDPHAPALNYDHVFVRDFSCCAPAFLARGETEIVRNFLLETLRLQSREETYSCLSPGRGLMPASFRPIDGADGPYLEPDYGEESIARVTPVDSVFWWLITLRAYIQASGEAELGRRQSVQDGIRHILDLALAARFEMFPTLLTPDGSFMIDRRMGVYGHPLEVQALFFLGLRAATDLLDPDDERHEPARRRIRQLAYHIRRYYWLDQDRLEELANGEVEAYGPEAANAYNIYPDTVPEWSRSWVPEGGGYFAGNIGPGRLDCRFYMQGNLLAALSGLATSEQSQALMVLLEKQWDCLAAQTPFKLCYPAMEEHTWRIVTGADPKNKPWSYHNGGSWPFLAWTFGLCAQQAERRDLLERAVKLLEKRLPADDWPEYYETPDGDVIGEQARLRQSWTLAGFLAAKDLLENRSLAELYVRPQNIEAESC